MTDLEAVLYLRQVSKYLNAHKSIFCPSKDDTELQAIMDEIAENITRTLYLFNAN
jgi:cell fate (sporulation/competence/biofilm development) regulator YlbF (YheA/YmcA/DUF963 family)